MPRPLAALILILTVAATTAACDPVIVAQDECVGVPAAKCRELIADARREGPVRSVSVRCAVTRCTDASGVADMRIDRGDGRMEQRGTAWSTPDGGPVRPPGPEMTPPVPPACLGVPGERCVELAASAVNGRPGVDPDTITGIFVRCTAVCDSVSGTGETTVHFRDGTEARESWGYEGG